MTYGVIPVRFSTDAGERDRRWRHLFHWVDARLGSDEAVPVDNKAERLQLVQNAAARLLTNTNRREHITPVLNSLHWFSVPYRIDFKLLMFVFKALNGLAPLYLSELLY